ncbi:MAG TPA: PQQ-dependent sugar dehydrogenase [Hyphomicrobium sp.]|nr:PQQ-dependent sugar dehydrogenase [Hyphomicrobium sp.]
MRMRGSSLPQALGAVAAILVVGVFEFPGTSAARAGQSEVQFSEDLTGPATIIPIKPAASEIIFEPRLVTGPLEMPWGMAFLPDGRLLVTERPGRLRIIESGTLRAEAISGAPEVMAAGHSGLLDVLVDRDFPNNQRIFLSYMHGVKGAVNMRVMSARLEGNALTDQKVIFDSRPAIAGTDQIGGRLAYGPDDNLYLTIGDRFEKDRAQDLMDHSGSIVRFREDGSIPEDNPFIGRDDALPEIYSYGHRNPQGLVVRDGKLWEIEHGPYGGDELNILEAGGNYGWPLVTFGIDYNGQIISDRTSAPGLVDPVHKWVPSVAPSSLAAYSGNAMPEEWQGGFVIGTLSGERLVHLTIHDDAVVREEQLLHKKIGRIRNVAVSPDGYIYLLTDGGQASIYRLDPVTDEVASGGASDAGRAGAVRD